MSKGEAAGDPPQGFLPAYARWMPQAFERPSATHRNQAPLGRARSQTEMPCNYLSTQKPCASTPSGTLNLLRKFSMATAAVSSTNWASVK